jgi:hypothetical protein
MNRSLTVAPGKNSHPTGGIYMKRDWDIIRLILTKIESDSNGKVYQLSDFSENDPAIISYHMELLLQACLIEGSMNKHLGPGPYDFMARRLSWGGHDFIDAIRNDKVWKKTKDNFLSKGIDMTFELVKTVASEIALSFIKS